jgi:hypothetical protein
MPNLSASDYTQYLKFKAAAASPIRPAIQTRDNVTLSQSVINANVLASQAAFVVAPASTAVITADASVTDAKTNVITAAISSSANILYTTSQPHGLVAGQIVTITGLTQNTLTVDPNVTATAITAVVSDTQFRIQVGTVSGVASGTGSITGRVYYTTSAAHGLTVGDPATVTGISTFTASGATVLAVPSATTFVLQSTTTGTAVTGASGVLTFIRYNNQFTTIRSLARVMPYLPGTTNNPNALSAISHSAGSVFAQPGGLPAKNRVGTYTRLPQIA